MPYLSQGHALEYVNSRLVPDYETGRLRLIDNDPSSGYTNNFIRELYAHEIDVVHCGLIVRPGDNTLSRVFDEIDNDSSLECELEDEEHDDTRGVEVPAFYNYQVAPGGLTYTSAGGHGAGGLGVPEHQSAIPEELQVVGEHHGFDFVLRYTDTVITQTGGGYLYMRLDPAYVAIVNSSHSDMCDYRYYGTNYRLNPRTATIVTGTFPATVPDPYGTNLVPDIDPEEEHMPERMRKPDGPYDLRVTWDNSACCYHVRVPAGNPLNFVDERLSDLATAMGHATALARRLREHTSNSYTHRPRRGTKEYKDLENHINWEPVSPDYDGMTEFNTEYRAFVATFKGMPEPVAANVSAARTICNFIQRKAAIKYGHGVNNSLVREIRQEVIDDIRKETDGAVVFVPTWGDSASVAHSTQVATLTFAGDWAHHGREARTVTVSKSFISEECHQCVECKNHFLSTDIKPVNVGSVGYIYCKDCYTRVGFYSCGLCHTTHRSNDVCPSYEQVDLSTIFNYSQDVLGIIHRMHHLPSDKKQNGEYLRYGVELEVLIKPEAGLGRNSVAKLVGNSLKYQAILKADSSIGSDGFEIVSVPATLEYHKTKMWNAFFGTDERGKSTLREGAKAPAHYTQSWNTNVCGIHVHITREAMTKMQLSKLCVFYHEPGNNGFLSRIAGRSVNDEARYCRAMKKRLGSRTAKECGDHHDAITISSRNRGKTAEVRIFRGNSSRHGLMRCLEFVDATVQWCANNGAKELTYVNFLLWFNQSSVRSRYPDLWRHLIQLGYLKTSHKSKGKTTLEVLPESARIA